MELYLRNVLCLFALIGFLQARPTPTTSTPCPIPTTEEFNFNMSTTCVSSFSQKEIKFDNLKQIWNIEQEWEFYQLIITLLDVNLVLSFYSQARSRTFEVLEHGMVRDYTHTVLSNFSNSHCILI